MADGTPALAIVQTLLLAGILVTTTMVTCSNDRLEKRVIKMEKSLEAGGGGGGSGPRRGGGDGPSAADAAPRVPGQSTGIRVAGWMGREAEILHVEGAGPNAPLTLSQKPRPQGDWYVNRRTSAPRSLNYYASNEGETTTVTEWVLGYLLRFDFDDPTQVMPWLATSWEVSDDRLSYTYHLRKGVQFADGRPFTAADVLFSYAVMRDPEVRAEHLRSEFDDVESITAPDPHTVVVRYKKLFWKGLYTVGFSLRPLNKGWYEEQIPVYARKLDIAKYATEPGKPGFGEVFNKIRIPCPGTGPYFVESDEDFQTDHVDLKQNPFYFGTQSQPEWFNMKRLRWIYISDEIAAFEAFRKGEFDVTVVDADMWADQLINDRTLDPIAVHLRYDHLRNDCSYIGWNCRRPPFDDARVRRAMTHLTDRKWILEKIERGRGTIAVCKSKRIYPTYSNELEPHPFDLDKARALLAEAGWRDTDGDGVLDRDGKRLEFELKVPSGRTFFDRVGGRIEDACKRVGIRMSVRSLEWATFIKDFDDRNFDGACLYSSWPDPWIDLYEAYHSSQDIPNGGNTSGWRDKRVDELLERMKVEFDDAKRTAMFHEFNRLYYDAQPQTLLVHGEVDVLCNKRFENIKVRRTGLQFFDWWVKPEHVLHK